MAVSDFSRQILETVNDHSLKKAGMNQAQDSLEK
jgi:hypothetical protein